MSREAIIDLITREVMGVVARRAPDAPPSAPTARQAPREAPASAPYTDAPALGPHPILLVCGNPLGRDETAALFSRLRESHPRITALLSPSAVPVFSDARRIFAGRTLDAEDRDFRKKLAMHSAGVVVNTSVNVVAKLASLIADSSLTIAVFELLRASRPVYVVQDPLLPWYVNGAVAGRVARYLAELGELGIRVVGAADLGRASPAVAPGPGAPLPDKATDCRTCAWAGHCVRLCPDRVSAFVERGGLGFASVIGMEAPPSDLAGAIDHTLLKPDARREELERLCDEAARYKFASVCVNPSWVRLCKTLLSGTGVKVATVIGFPLGATSTAAKEAEAHEAVAAGADELDMVINVGALKGGDLSRVLDDIKAVVRAAQGRVVKVILETALLTDEEKVKACELSRDAGAQFVKTSTGFGPGGATVHDVELMRRVVGPHLGVKASGGVRDHETAARMVAAGASRLGTSSSIAIVTKARTAAGAAQAGYDTPSPPPAAAPPAAKTPT